MANHDRAQSQFLILSNFSANNNTWILHLYMQAHSPIWLLFPKKLVSVHVWPTTLGMTRKEDRPGQIEAVVPRGESNIR